MEEIQERCKSYGTRLHVLAAAVGRSASIATMYVREEQRLTSLLENWEGKVYNVFDVPLITLDIAIEKYGIPFYCKIDVEGYELEVLLGLSSSIPLLSFEYHLSRDVKDVLQCIERLEELGMKEINMTPAENLVFLFPEWKPIREFKNWFPGDMKNNDKCHYGDIFVRKN